MEEPQGQQDMPMAELPKQLDDLIGDLMKQEQADDPEKDDVSSSIMDSIDKGAGWGAADGPMSNMSAKGVTGNQLPNNDEIGGRSGEGRNGKSDGQMVGNTAVGKGGNETPTRMTPTPFENGSVNDQSKDTQGRRDRRRKAGGTRAGGLARPDAAAGAATAPRAGRPAGEIAATGRVAGAAIAQAAEAHRRSRVGHQCHEGIRKGRAQPERSGVVQGYHQALDSLQAARARLMRETG